MQRASQHGVEILIRIYPSPGNFITATHRLSLDPAPIERCKPQEYRSYRDVVTEIVLIHEYNNSVGIKESGFVPANEPNLEWYPAPWELGPIKVNNPQAWTDMDAYFALIYKEVHSRSSDIKVLTPPMCQNKWAETYMVTIYPVPTPPLCQPMHLAWPTPITGYETMTKTFLYGTHNDGYTWNNYWARGGETWAHCGETDIPGQHVAAYFPPTMQANVLKKGGIITEADLASTEQHGIGVSLKNKDEDAGRQTAWSLREFLTREPMAGRIAVWNLNVSYDDLEKEQNWHEAYRNEDNNCERVWFKEWWSEGTVVPLCTVWPTYTPPPHPHRPALPLPPPKPQRRRPSRPPPPPPPLS